MCLTAFNLQTLLWREEMLIVAMFTFAAPQESHKYADLIRSLVTR